MEWGRKFEDELFKNLDEENLSNQKLCGWWKGWNFVQGFKEFEYHGHGKKWDEDKIKILP